VEQLSVQAASPGIGQSSNRWSTANPPDRISEENSVTSRASGEKSAGSIASAAKPSSGVDAAKASVPQAKASEGSRPVEIPPLVLPQCPAGDSSRRSERSGPGDVYNIMGEFSAHTPSTTHTPSTRAFARVIQAQESSQEDSNDACQAVSRLVGIALQEVVCSTRHSARTSRELDGTPTGASSERSSGRLSRGLRARRVQQERRLSLAIRCNAAAHETTGGKRQQWARGGSLGDFARHVAGNNRVSTPAAELDDPVVNPDDDVPSPFEGIRNLMSTAGRWCAEEPLNAVDFAALLSATALLAVLLLDDDFADREVAAPYGRQGGRFSSDMAVWLSLTVLCMLMRHLRALYFIPTLGPLLLIMQLIVVDLFKFTFIFAFTLMPFSGAMFALFSSEGLICPDRYILQPFNSFGTSLAFLLDTTINMAGDFGCVAGAPSHTLAIAATVILMTFVVTMALLLANMLIASMAKTFDDVYSDQETNFMFQRARNMLSCDSIDPLPPPFNLLSLPFWLVRVLLLMGSCGRYDAWPTYEELQNKEEMKHLLRWLPTWTAKVKHEDATSYVLEFVQSHESLAVENGKWRTRLMARVGKLEQSLEARDPPMKALANDLQAVKRDLRSKLKAEGLRDTEVSVELAKCKEQTRELLAMLNLAVTGCGTQTSTSAPGPKRAAADPTAQDGTAPLPGPTTAAASSPTQAAPPPRPCAEAVPGRSSATDSGARRRTAQRKDASAKAVPSAVADIGTSVVPTRCEEAPGGGRGPGCSHPEKAATPTSCTPPSENPTRTQPVTLSDAFRGYTRQRVFDDTPGSEDRRSSEHSSASRQSGSRSSYQSHSPMPPGDIVALSLDTTTLLSPAATRPASVQPASMLSSWLRSTITGGGAHGTPRF